MAAPIWRDRFVTLGSGAQYYDYEIRLGSAAGATIYSGRAWARPGAADVVVRINDICADYLQTQLPAHAGGGWTSFEVAARFVTLVGGVQKDDVTFYADWSYNPAWNVAAMGLSDPVRRTIDPRMWLLVSQIDASQINVLLTFGNGQTATVVVAVARSADFNNDFNLDFSQSESGAKSGAVAIDLTPWDDLAAVTIGGQMWRVAPICARYALYYVNAYGGWDFLAVEGAVKEGYDLERHTTRQDYDNGDPAARGIRDYAIGVTPSWSLSTGLLSDDESGRMHHLLASTNVYLYDLADGTFRPVVLTDTRHEVQTYQGNGRQPNNYMFTAQLAQDRIRR